MVMVINDIMIYSKSDEDHAEHLRILLQILKDKKLCAKLSKCELWLKKVSFLERVMYNGGIGVHLLKVNVVFQWETPKFSTEIRSFICLDGYYRRFIEGFSKLEMPLT